MKKAATKQQKRREKAPGEHSHYKQDMKAPFLEAFKEQGTIQGGAVKTGLDRATIYRWFEEDPKFKAEFEAVKHRYRPDLVDRLESTALQQALNGDAQLIKFLLQSWAREMYGEKYVHEIEYKITSSLVSETLEVMRKNIPELCSGCGKHLGIVDAIVKDMEAIMARESKKNAIT